LRVHRRDNLLIDLKSKNDKNKPDMLIIISKLKKIAYYWEIEQNIGNKYPNKN